MDMQRRRFLEGIGIGAAGLAAATIPERLSAQGVRTVADRNSVKAGDFGALGDGVKDDSDAIQRAVDSANALGGGTVYLEGTRGRDFRCAKPLILDDRRGIRLLGNSGPNALGGGQAPAQLIFTGVQGPFISLRSSHSISFDGLTIGYNDPAFRSALVATDHSPVGKADPSNLVFDRCSFTGINRATGASALLDLGFCISSTVRNCEFKGADVGVVGSNAPGRYSNVVQISSCVFRDLKKVAIKSACESWLISGCTFEASTNGTGAAYFQGPGTLAWGLVIIGCWMGDAGKPGGCWIDMSQGGAVGLTIIGNRIAAPGTGPTDTAIKIGSGNQGVSITGNRIEGAIGIDFTAGYTFGTSIISNDLQCKTPVANLQNAMNHFIAGHYTTPNRVSGSTTFDTGTFNGDGVRGSINLVPQMYIPTTPKDGDMWATRDGLYVRIAGATRRVNLT
jgi:hypothetical protein